MIDIRLLPAVLLAVALIAATGCSSDRDRASDPPAAISSQSSTGSGVPAGGTIQSPDEPAEAPDVTVETMNGESIALANRPNEVLLVNFWATWCAPCRKEIPDLIALQEELGPQGLTIIGISLDQQGAEAVNPFLADYSINYPIVLDQEGAVEEAFGGIYGLPMTYVIGPEGRIQHRVLGLFPIDEMRPKLVALLDGSDENAQS
jgi:thiol-disulfide isomerase/thioredoxin